MHVNGRRVVVTGLGAVSPLGLDALSFWDALVAGRSGISHLTTVDPGDTGVSIAGQIEGFEARRFVDGRTARLIDRAALLFAAASDEALRDARLDPRGRDVAVVAGVDTALATTAQIATGFHTQGQLGVDAYALVQALPNTASGLADRLAAEARRTPGGRLPTMQEVAGAVLFLASDLAAGVNGTDLVVDRGWLIA